MRVNSLSLISYRNYDQLDLELKPGINLFFGKNGQGKTNLVEAIGFCSTLSSHRSPNSSLIGSDKTTASIGSVIENNQKTLRLGVEINKDAANRFSLNGNIVKRSSEILGLLTSVIFSPEDIDLIRRDPQTRRSFLNNLGIQLKPAYYKTLQDYDRVLKQRNALLKSARGKPNVDLSTLELWDENLIDLSVKIITAREELITKLLPLIHKNYDEISSTENRVLLQQQNNFEINYQQSADDLKKSLQQTIETQRHNELDRGVTLVGPHRDEMLITLNGLTAKEHASQGEAWSLALSLKIASAELISKVSDTGQPVMILDDVFSVLDTTRRNALTSFVTGYEQVLITAAVEQDVPIESAMNKFSISGGRVE